MTEQELGAHISATRDRPSTTGDTPASVESAKTELRHVHLPVLAAVGLVAWDREAGTVEPAAHPALDDPRFGLLLAVETEGLDAALAHVADNRRRFLLTTLRDAETSVTRHDLARELVRSDETDVEPAPDAVDDVVSSLHHVHLPALDVANLVEYDTGSGRTLYAEHPALEEIFTIIYETDNRLADSYDGFLEGMKAALNQLGQETGTKAEWPHSWEDPQRG